MEHNTVRVNEEPGDRLLVPGGDWATKVLESGLVFHDTCGGWMQLRSVARFRHVLYCEACGLRVVLPMLNFETTWLELNRYYASFYNQG